jgi:hypothetical protein
MSNGTLAEDVLEYLKNYHTEESEAIKGRELCELFNITARQVRILVSRLRRDGEAVCSSTHGYWYSTDPADIDITLRRLEEQVKHMNSAITGLKGILAGGVEE